ncbi:MAG: hypothetical protein IPJ65_31785 [Archangiaceae bacterium]|nr:hypothetical protein [Archangiaceae bacterium]
MRQLLSLGTLSLLTFASCSADPTATADGNHPPEVLDWSCDPQVGEAPLTTTCRWQIRDPDVEAVKCELDVGADGSLEAAFAECPSASSSRFELATPGNVTVRLTLTDARGLTKVAETVIGVSARPNEAPTIATFSATPLTGGTPLPVTFTFAVADPDGDALTCRLLDADAELVAASACASSETRAATLTAVGVHRVTLEVVDGRGGRATYELTVTVDDLPQVGDLRISRVEFGQTVVSQAPRLVAGKDALLRVYVLSERPGIGGVTVKVTALSNGATVGEAMLTGPATAPTAESANDLTQQWRTTLPGAWLAAGVQLSVQVDPANRLGESNETNNTLSLTPTVGLGSVLPVTHVPIVQSGRTGTPRQIEPAMKQIWPLKGVDQKTRAAYTFSGTIAANGAGWDDLLEQLATIRQSDGSRRNYLGWLSVGFGSGVAGLGYVGIGAALTRDDEVSTSVHELGHNLGREHAPCGGAAGADRNYPVANARLDVQGFDPVSGRLVAAAQAFDVMSYCDPAWVSQYNYKAVQAWLESHPVTATTAVTAARVVVAGRLSRGQVTLQPLTVIEAPADGELEAGEYTLTLHGEQPVSVPFAMSRVADGLDDAHFSLLLPVVPGLYAATVSQHGKVLATRVAGPQQPAQQASVRAVPGGVELRWNAAAFAYASVAHLGDGGRTTLTLWAEGGRAFVSTEGLEGGGAFEVSLSDGVQSQRLLLAR